MFKVKNAVFSHPLQGDTAEMISLWQTTFQDSDKFTTLFFSRIYKPENTLVIKNDGRIVSALQMIPYKIKTTDGIIPSAYVCGVCTLTSERGKGLMKALMLEAMDNMLQKGYGITTLIPAHPWLFDFYKNLGYIHNINYRLESYSCEVNPDMQYKTIKSNIQAVEQSHDYFSDIKIAHFTRKYFTYFNKKQHERRCAVLHNDNDINNIISDLINDDGNAWIALRNDTPVGIAFTCPISEKNVIIKEMLYDSILIKEALIHHILNIYKAKKVIIRIPPQESSTTEMYNISNAHLSVDLNKKIYPYGLANILDKRITDINGLHMTLMLD